MRDRLLAAHHEAPGASHSKLLIGSRGATTGSPTLESPPEHKAADTVTTRRIKLRNERLTAMASSDFKIPYQRTGFVPFAESLNGRLAMLGFVIAIATEALSGKGILGQLGLD
jgi:hypothetical protein